MKQPQSIIATKDVKVLSSVNHMDVLSKTLEELKFKDLDDSFYICNIGDIVQKHLYWLQLLPRIQPHYAIKCNPDNMMLQSLIAMGTGFDCASKAEIRQMLDLGVDPESIIYANPCKQLSHIRYARDNNVSLLVFDNVDELKKTKKVFPNAKLVLRIQTDDSAATCQLSMKYGAPLHVCEDLLLTAFNMGLDVVGISFHVGSGTSDSTAFVDSIKNSRKLFDYASEIGFEFSLLDIGGGFPGTTDVELPFDRIANDVNKELNNSFPLKTHSHVKIIAEPGRYYAASAFTLVTNVIARKRSEKDSLEEVEDKDDSNTTMMYYVNDGVYDSFNCMFYDHANPKPSFIYLSDNRNNEGKCYQSSIWGPTCDGLDKLNDSLFLPYLNIGDWLVWNNMGAYTVAAGSAFNGFKTKNIFYFISESDLSLLKEHVGKSILYSTSISFEDFQFVDNDKSEVPLHDLRMNGNKSKNGLSFFNKCIKSKDDEIRSGLAITAKV